MFDMLDNFAPTSIFVVADCFGNDLMASAIPYCGFV